MIEENVLLGEQQLVSLAQVLCTVVKETNVCVQALLSTLSQMQPPITYSRWIDLQKKQKKKMKKQTCAGHQISQHNQKLRD